MDTIHLSFWQMLLLCCPMLVGLAIFAYLLWSDIQYYRKKRKTNK